MKQIKQIKPVELIGGIVGAWVLFELYKESKKSSISEKSALATKRELEQALDENEKLEGDKTAMLNALFYWVPPGKNWRDYPR